MNRIARRSMVTLVLVLFLAGGFGFFLVEYFTKSSDWVIHAGSPHVYNGGNIGCGVIVDRDGALLLDTTDGRTYSNSEQLRKATIHWVGDRYGNISAPALSAYAAQMAGYSAIDGVYAFGNSGAEAKLTLSAQVQTAALEALGDRKGCVAVYNYKTGQLICGVTTPTYDPDNIPQISDDDEAYEGVYLNRLTQSVYIPGSIFKIVTLAAALDTIPDIQEQSFSCTGVYYIGNDEITCGGPHGIQSLKTAFMNSCNCAFAQVAKQLGGKTLQEYVDKLDLTEPLQFDGITTAAGNFSCADGFDANVAWSAIGQHNDQMNMCRFLSFVGAIANGGTEVRPYIVSGITSDGSQTYRAHTQFGEQLISRETAQLVLEYMRYNVVNYYGDYNFPGLQVCAKTGTGEVGGGKKPNAMIAGFCANEEYPLAFVVAVEDGGFGGDVCIPVLSKVLEACKKAI